jgi:DNA-binding CsgD family transcriptional regulator
VERDSELGVIDAALETAASGQGAAVVISGAAGIGKSALVRAAAGRGRTAGATVLSAFGGDLEVSAPWSVARQLYWPVLSGTDDGRRWLSDPRFVGLPFGGGAPPAGDRLFGGLHALYWLTVQLAEDAPLLLLVDDAHLTDPPSGQLLVFLARRLADLPVTLVVAGRPAATPGDGLLPQVAAATGVSLLEPAPLREAGVATLLREEGADPSLAAACREATGGTPLLVHEVARALATAGRAAEDDPAERVRQAASRGVAHTIVTRIAGAGDEANAFVGALAVLDRSPGVELPGRLAGLGRRDAADVADELCASGLLVPGPPLRFFHPLVRDAVYEQLPAARRDALHRAAATALAARGAHAAAAAHLTQAAPDGAPEAVKVLRTAAAEALAHGDAATAAALLERALAEPPPGRAERAAVRAERGVALARAGHPDSAAVLTEALEETDDVAARAEIAAALGPVLVWMGRPRRALEVLEEALDALGDEAPALRVRLQLEVLATTRRDVRLRTGAADRVARLREVAGGTGGAGPIPDPAQRLLLAALAFDAIGHAPAAEAAELARRALGDGRLLEEQGPESPALSLAVIALWMAEDLDGTRAALDPAVEAAREQGSVLGFVMMSCWRSHVAWRAGDLDVAEADASGALEVAREMGLPPAVTYAVATLGDARIERGDVAGAAALLDEPLLLGPIGGDHDQPLLYYRGRLRAAQGRWREAHEDLVACGEGLAAFGATTPVLPWRGDAAAAALALGEEDEARGWAAEGVEVARTFGVPGALGAALRRQAAVTGEVAPLEEAVDLLAASPLRLEHARALAELGARRRDDGDPDAARAVLREALDGADRCGATALAEEVRGALVALGARPRRRRTTGPAALTPSELRVCGLAAEGRTNREIAQALFVTLRTVEMHLSNAYRKLDIAGRSELAAALAGD